MDNDKNIIGCDKWSELQITGIIHGQISPIPQFDIKTFKLKNGKKIFVVKVEEGMESPYITEYKQKYSSESIYNHLFYTCYSNLGCIDFINIEDDD